MNPNVRKIGILCFWPFPEGMAPTARIMSYSKGLTTKDVQVEIISFRRIFKDDVKRENIKMTGFVEGIKYTYPHFFSEKGKRNKLYRGIDEIILRLKVLKTVILSHYNFNFDFLFFSFDDLHSLNTYTKLLYHLNVPIVLVADEYPIPIRDFGMSEVPPDYIFKYKKVHKKIHFRIVMTEALKTFYNEKISLKPTHIMSSVTDISRFDGIQKQIVDRQYICYMGNMGLAKDNVDNIIRAFGLIADDFKDIDLHLYGTPNNIDRTILENLIEERNLSERIFIKGRANFDSVPRILVNAHILVASQPVTKRAEGGFPTKLGEYLMSNVPSVLTDVGEIHQYIKDGVNAYLVEPCNPQKYAEKLSYIICNYSDALNVAKKGKQYIIDNFSNNSVSKKMLAFLNDQKKLIK